MSNSDASEAKSSSSSGSSSALTELTLTLIRAFSPSCLPASRVPSKLVSSPADRPRGPHPGRRAWWRSRARSSRLLGVDGFAVDFGVEVDVGVVTLGGRTVNAHEGAETLAQGFQTVVDVLIGDLGLGDLDLHPSRAGSSMSGRRSTVATNFSLVSSLADSGTS